MSRPLNRLWVRLTLALLLVAWLSVAVVALVVRSTTEAGFRQYLDQRSLAGSGEQIARFEDYYAQSGAWQGVEALFSGRGSQRESDRRGAQFIIADPDGHIVAATDEARIGAPLTPDEQAQATPLVVDGATVGLFVRQTPGAEALGEAEAAFLSQSTQWLTLAALAGTGLALLVGLALAWTLVRPLRALLAATRDLATGKLGRQAAVGGTAEIRELAATFNDMSARLAQGETLRRRLAADVAHELRTPVTVLRGHLEAMMDGVYPLDAEHVAVAYDQTVYLSRLVEDLRLLTLAEAAQLPLERRKIAPGEIVNPLVEAFAPLALDGDIRLSAQLAPDLPSLTADPVRLRQILSNLLTNAVRHTPPGGEIRVSVVHSGGMVRFRVQNTGSALSPQELVEAFTPFWRADDARERDRSGSGLGLAISRQLAALHGGKLWAESGADWTAFVADFPGA